MDILLELVNEIKVHEHADCCKDRFIPVQSVICKLIGKDIEGLGAWNVLPFDNRHFILACTRMIREDLKGGEFTSKVIEMTNR